MVLTVQVVKIQTLLLVIFVSGTSVVPSPRDSFSLADFEEQKTFSEISAFPWPTNKDGTPATASVALKRTDKVSTQGNFALEIEYSFPSELCTQVVLDIPIFLDRCYEKIQLSVYGDESGNRVEIWLAGGGKWFGQGSFVLDFKGWKELTFPVSLIDTDIANTFRICIVQNGGLGKHTLFIDDVEFSGISQPKFSDLHIFQVIPEELFQSPPSQKAFKIQKVKRDDRTILLLDGEPLFCVLDVSFTKGYLLKAKEAGVNCFAIDLYWSQLEPRKGYREWYRLREMIRCLKHWGFGVIFILGPHQPNWWVIQHQNEPGARQRQAYILSPALKRDFGSFLQEFVKQTRDFPNVLGYMISAGGEQDTSFPEVLGYFQESPWRQSSSCLSDFRNFLGEKYKNDIELLRKAWGEPNITFRNATPPHRLSEDDYRRSWLDWCEFANSWWIQFVRWAGGIVKRLAPGKIFQVRFGWPVFQAENIFLVRKCPFVDLVQCKDAIASWEVGHPGYQRYRTALYMGACKHSDKIVFPEMDIIHNRGTRNPQFQQFMPLFADMAGALWYYRGLPDDSFLDEFRQAITEAKKAILKEYPKATVGIFYSLAYANWISLHTNYTNENSLVGVCELLDDLGLRYAMVSEFNLDDLPDYKVLILPYNPAISERAEKAIEEFIRRGGAVIAEADVGEFVYEKGKGRRASGTLPFLGVIVKNKELVKGTDVILKGLGLEGLSLSGPTELREQIEARGEVIGTFRDGTPAIILGKGGKTLYFAWRFFLHYSFGDGEEQKLLKRKIISTFLYSLGIFSNEIDCLF